MPLGMTGSPFLLGFAANCHAVAIVATKQFTKNSQFHYDFAPCVGALWLQS